MNRREIVKALTFLAIGALAGGQAVAYLWRNATPDNPKADVAVVATPTESTEPKPIGGAISRKEFKTTLKNSGLDGLTKLIGSPDKLGPPGHPTLAPCWIYLRRTYDCDPGKRDASAYVFRYENGAIESVSFHEN